MTSTRYASGGAFILPPLQAVRLRSHLRERENEDLGESMWERREGEIRDIRDIGEHNFHGTSTKIIDLFPPVITQYQKQANVSMDTRC